MKVGKALLKVLGVFLAVFVLALVGLQIWFASYKVSDPVKAEEIYQTAVQKVRERDKLAADPEQNAFADVQEVFYFRAADHPAGTSNPGDAWRALQVHNPAALGEKVDYAKPSPEVQAAIKAYEAHLPEVEKLLSSPHILYPSQWDKGWDAVVPNFILLRSIAQQLAGYTDYLLAQGRDKDALRYALLNQQFGPKFMEQGPLITGMIGIALSNIANHELRRVVMLGKLDRHEYERVIQELDALPLKPERYLDRMDEEYALSMVGLDRLGEGTGSLGDEGPPGGAGLLKWSGFLAREKRLLQQLYLEDRAIVEKMGEFPAGHAESREALMKRSYAILVQILAPNMARAYANFRWSLTQVSATKILAALQIYRLEHKRYPDKLEQLVPNPLAELPRDWSGGGFVYTPDGKGGFELRSSSQEENFSKPLWPVKQY